MTIGTIALAPLIALLVWRFIAQGNSRWVLAWAVADLIALPGASTPHLFRLEQYEATVFPMIVLTLLPAAITAGLLAVGLHALILKIAWRRCSRNGQSPLNSCE